MSGYPLAYLPWQARDVLRGPGLVTAVIAGVFAVMVWQVPAPPGGGSGAALLTMYLEQVAWPLALVATGETVRTDRTAGFYRFYFSRPVQPALFYLVRYLLGFALVLAAVAVSALVVMARTGEAALEARTVGHVALTYLLVGGTVFLVSTVTTAGPRDWLVALIVHIHQNIVADLLANGAPVPSVLRALHAALPPMHLLRAGAPAGDVLHAALYGAALVAAALLLLHHRPLGGGARD